MFVNAFARRTAGSFGLNGRATISRLPGRGKPGTHDLQGRKPAVFGRAAHGGRLRSTIAACTGITLSGHCTTVNGPRRSIIETAIRTMTVSTIFGSQLSRRIFSTAPPMFATNLATGVLHGMLQEASGTHAFRFTADQKDLGAMTIHLMLTLLTSLRQERFSASFLVGESLI